MYLLMKYHICFVTVADHERMDNGGYIELNHTAHNSKVSLPIIITCKFWDEFWV